MNIDAEVLIKEAIEARKMAYTPYSHFKVGAALLTAAGYTPSNCAERTAFFKAVSEGERSFAAIAIVAGPENGDLVLTAPCGVCRQVMMEFCDYETFPIILGSSPKDYKIMTLKEILPLGFGPKNLNIEL